MKFLDRRRELDRLDAVANAGAAGLVAIWGRRRVGKTRLLVEWCGRHGGLYTVADQSAEPVQRRYLAEAVSQRLSGFNETEYDGWVPLLRRLSRDARTATWRGPLVLDEFPYLVAASPSLPSILQNWIDQESATGGLLVAIAGSSQRMMQGAVLDAGAPLYGRAIEALALQPLPAGWIGRALGLPDAVSMVQAYAAWGGIPRYWELAQAFRDNLSRAVDHLVLDPLGPLHREPDRLLLEELPPAAALRPLLDVIGAGVHRLSEIGARLGQPATSLTRPIGRLLDLGLVHRDVPFGESEKSSRRALYRISDPFVRFWFRVVAPQRAALASASAAARLALWSRHADALTADAWEALCRSAVPGLSGAWERGSASQAWLPARRWWHGREPEWDVVSVGADGRAFVAGEAKWSTAPLADRTVERLAGELQCRPLPPGLPVDTDRVLFVPATRSRMTATRSGVRIVTADAVMKALR